MTNKSLIQAVTDLEADVLALLEFVGHKESCGCATHSICVNCSVCSCHVDNWRSLVKMELGELKHAVGIE